MKKLIALIITLSLGVTFTATTGISVKTIADSIFGVNSMPVSYAELPFNQDDGILEAGAKSADFIIEETEKAQKTIEDVMREYKDTVKDAMRIVGGN